MIDEAVLQAISTIGFPIVAFLLMWYQSNSIIKKNSEAIDKLTEMIREKWP